MEVPLAVGILINLLPDHLQIIPVLVEGLSYE